MPTSFVSYIALILVFAACSSTGTTSSASPRSNVIATDELAEVSHLNALEAVQRLRPVWLKVRGQPTFRAQMVGVRIYVDGVRRGDNAGELRRIRVSDVGEMRFLSAREATIRYGTDHQEGAILVVLKG
jgi:hypothetical protein